EVSIGGSLSDPNAVLKLTARDAGLAEIRSGLDRINGEAEAEWRAGRLVARASAKGGQGLDFRAEASLPLTAKFSVPGEGALQGRLHVEGDLGRLAEVLPLGAHHLVGRIDADATLGGTVARPDVDGHAVLAGATYENFDTGTVVRKLAVDVTARDSSHFTVKGGGEDGKGGTLAIAGDMEVGERGVSYSIAIEPQSFRAVNTERITALASGGLRLEGVNGEAMVRGTVRVDRGEVNIGERLPPEVVRMDVVEVNRKSLPRRGVPGQEGRNAARPPAVKGSGEGPVAIRLDVALTVQRLAVRGKGLESEWRGDLQIGGTASVPVLSGKLTAERGTYDLIGRSFKLSRGD
ncbi:MAG: translocation/assembly module TamB, partial [Rhodospirillales bacterium]|nr:translocation/assembly module TamB [Rhodospirillales bacterium]